MKVGLFGFGKAGRAVASVFLQKEEVELCWIVRQSKLLQHRSVTEFLGIESDEGCLIFSKDEWSAAQLFETHPVDVIIDFSGAEGITFYGKEAANKGIAIVSAISEYSAENIEFLKEISDLTKVLWSPNITIGINFLILAAKVLKNIAPYTDIEIIEEHFKDKKGTSGTAKKIAQALEIEEDDIKKIRAGGIIGHHEILFGFPYQTVRLRHDSISREAFGNGALFAAMNILNREKGFYTMEDLLIPYFNLISP
ncbi:MAG: dihydrodipicolinate reductase C-terminal domain-containing protein [Methylococcales bacterium]|nr:dihydrodipicolinate reductase C-terminal domain-containing protein [Methylococcales bacterium]